MNQDCLNVNFMDQTVAWLITACCTSIRIQVSIPTTQVLACHRKCLFRTEEVEKANARNSIH